MFLVLGNVAIDDAMQAPAWPTPGATVLVGPPARDLGGKGANQALVLRRAGAPVRFVATIGDDDAATWIAQALVAEGLDPGALIRLSGPSDRSLIFVAPGGENAIASTSHCSDALTPVHAEAAIAAAASGDILVMQGGLTLETTRAAFAAARKKAIPVIFNPSAMREGYAGLLAGVDLLVLNAVEATQLAGDGAPSALAARLRASGPSMVVITLGGDGALGLGPGGEVILPAGPAIVCDSTGAGDCYLAVLAAALYGRDLPLPHAMALAARAAAITVSRPGTRAAFPTADELGAIFAGA